MPVSRSIPDMAKFNRSLSLPFNLRIDDFAMAMRDVYDFFQCKYITGHERAWAAG